MSIRRYLTLILIALITLTVFLATIKGYRQSVIKAQALFDTQLQSLANIVAKLPQDNVLTELSNTPDFSIQLWDNERLLLKSEIVPISSIAPFKAGFSFQNFNGQRWRVWSELISRQRWLMVAQPIAVRTDFTEQVILAAVTPIIISIVLLAIITSLILRRALAPLTKLATLIKYKKVNDLSPILMSDVPAEIKPVIARLNHLFECLNDAFLREKHFASDAAHELRTPLSILKVNLYNLSQEQPESTPLTHLALGLERMSNIVDQILMLNRTNPEQFTAKFTAVNLTHAAQNMVSDLYPAIIEKQQVISLDGDDCWINGDKMSIDILLQNLITNAIKYTPARGIIKITIAVRNTKIELIVEDSGPGIDKTLRERVFDRFYRVGGDQHQSNVIGCGLGLAISSHIAQLHETSILLGQSKTLGGLHAQMDFEASHEP